MDCRIAATSSGVNSDLSGLRVRTAFVADPLHLGILTDEEGNVNRNPVSVRRRQGSSHRSCRARVFEQVAAIRLSVCDSIVAGSSIDRPGIRERRAVQFLGLATCRRRLVAARRDRSQPGRRERGCTRRLATTDHGRHQHGHSHAPHRSSHRIESSRAQRLCRGRSATRPGRNAHTSGKISRRPPRRLHPGHGWRGRDRSAG